MGKSNKFDYTNRGNNGKRLGEIIGSALIKESEKVKKDAERHASKLRKQSSSSNDPSESPVTTHHLDLRAPSKDLGDDGVAAFADGLEEALKNGTSTACLALEMLTLSGNGLTVASLARLAPVIELAGCELKLLDLSSNKIKVETDEESEQWETFLRSFKGSQALQHLDFNHNRGLGTRALEVFARVYLKEPPISPHAEKGHDSIHSPDSDDGYSTDGDSKSTPSTDGVARTKSRKTSDKTRNRHCGLRSIPFIGLADVALTDFEALWLSYIITEHWYPCQLLVNPEDNSHSTSDHGIDWSGHSLGKDGLNLLNRAEELRRSKFLSSSKSNSNNTPQLTDLSNLSNDLASTHLGNSGNSNKRRAGQPPNPNIKLPRCSGSLDHNHAELDSLRRKFQRHQIELWPPAGKSELWTTALELFNAARKVFYLSSSFLQTPKTKKIDLPVGVIQRIAEFGLSDERRRRSGMLTERQKRVVVAWGMDRGGLLEERDWARRGAATQVWMVLDQMQCLAYEEEEEDQDDEEDGEGKKGQHRQLRPSQ